MDTERALLKARLMQSRAVPRPPRQPYANQSAYYVTLCDICGEPDPSHLHENIVTRADVMKNKPLQQLILTAEENVHLLCPACNLTLALAEPFHSWLISLNLYRYGLERITEWLESLPFTRTRPARGASETGPGQYLRKVRQVALDMNSNSFEYRWNLVAQAYLDRGSIITPHTYTPEEVKQWQSQLSPVRP